jgi:hypothetical protein
VRTSGAVRYPDFGRQMLPIRSRRARLVARITVPIPKEVSGGEDATALGFATSTTLAAGGRIERPPVPLAARKPRLFALPGGGRGNTTMTCGVSAPAEADRVCAESDRGGSVQPDLGGS